MTKFPAVRFLLAVLASAFLITFLSTALLAQSSPRITEAIDNKILTVVSHTTHPFATVANDRGRVDSNLPMQRMVLLFKPSEQQAAALKRLIDNQQDKASVNYQKWLSPEQFAAKFGPTDSDLKQITKWLAQQGFTVETTARGRQWLEFSGTAAQVERALHTEIHHYAVNGETHVANSTDISLPRALTPVVAGIVTLHNFQKHPLHGKTFPVHRDPQTGNLVPDFTTSKGNAHYLAPGDYRKIYNTDPLIQRGVNGSGVSIAIVGRTDIELSDVQTFRQIFGLPTNDPIFTVNGQDPGVNGDELESDLDVEWAGAVAPNATIQFVTSSSTFTTDGVDLSGAYIVDNVVAPIMSTSYGQCEAFLGPTQNAFYSTLYQQAAAEGITAIVSSGDNGPAGCDSPVSYNPAQNGLNVNGLASTPYNLAVGGTEFNENGHDRLYWSATNRPDLSSALGYIPEAVWNESCDPTIDPTQCGGTYLYSLFASSGGASNCSNSIVTNYQVTCLGGYSKPSWQAGKGVPNDNVRDIPDLALGAAGGHDGYLVCIEGSCQTTVVNGQTVLQSAAVVGGTSAAAPSMAGMMALVEQENGAYQGLANYRMYQLASADPQSGCNSSKLTDPTKQNKCVFHDVTAGTNTVPGQQGFSATAGYDMATGLGTVNAANLVASWTGAQKLDSTTALSSWSTTAQHGQPIGLNVAVSPTTGTGTPSGDISFVSKYGSVFGGTLAHGTLSAAVSNLPGGKYSMTAHYPGNAMFNASNSSAIGVQITPEPSKTNVLGYVINLAGIVVPIYGPLLYGQPLALQYSVNGNSGFGSATGNVTIDLDHTIKLGTFPLDQGGTGWTQVDNLQPTGLVPGFHTYTVTYSGDNSFLPAKTSISVTVRKVWPETNTFPVPNNITEGAPLRLLLSVPGGGVHVPTGTVQLYDNGRKLGNPIALQPYGEQGQGIAQAVATPTLGVGNHQLQTSYSGDANYSPVSIRNFNSRRGMVTVDAAVGSSTKVDLQQSASSVTLGQSVTYSVSVKALKSGGAVPTGTASLVEENGGILASPIPLVNGTASFVLPWNFAGKSSITAAYSGDATFGPFSSPVIVTTVNRATPNVSLIGASSQVPPKTQTSLTVSVVGQPANPNLSAPYGQVQFFDSVNGSAMHALGFPQYLTTGNGGNPIYTLPVVLPSGNNMIRVHYLGSGDWTGADSNSVTVVVQ
ncbi:MAG: protease-like protein [Acidobacteriaceae bacterium]|nr:protease-like protein [Acidobacteriaceae bacterium]